MSKKTKLIFITILILFQFVISSAEKLNSETISFLPAIQMPKVFNEACINENKINEWAYQDEATNDPIDFNVSLEVEIALIDQLQDILLSDYEFEFNYQSKCNNSKNKTEKLKTDKNGKVAIKVSEVGDIFYSIVTKDFAIYNSEIVLRKGTNSINANLGKGGIIEVRATANGEIVEGLTISKSGYKDLIKQPVLDATRGVYVYSNFPIGTQEIAFSARGCIPSDNYKIRVDSKYITKLDIKFAPKKKIYVNINIPNKPKVINISESIFFDMYSDKGRSEAVLGKNGDFEFILEKADTKIITIYADNYMPKKLNIAPEKNKYEITLTAGCVGKLTVVDESGKAVVGANVHYTDSQGSICWETIKDFKEGTFYKTAITDKDGVATLLGLEEKKNIELFAYLNEFTSLPVSWNFDGKSSNTLKTTLLNPNYLSGVVKFEGKPVEGAKIHLFEANSSKLLASTNSDSSGIYKIPLNKLKKNSDYLLKASHQNYGLAKSSFFLFDNKPKVDINLLIEKSITVKFVNDKGTPLPNRSIVINSNNTPMYVNKAYLTNENGEITIYNLMQGQYCFSSTDSKFNIGTNCVTVPFDFLMIKEQFPKNYVKLQISTKLGNKFNGAIKAYSGEYWDPIKVINENGVYFLETKESIKEGTKLIFEVDGYAILALEADKGFNQAEGLKIELSEGDSLNLKVLDESDGKPIPYANITLSAEFLPTNAIFAENVPKSNLKLCNLQNRKTNENGEITFNYLGNKGILHIRSNYYSPYNCEIYTASTKDFVVKLKKK